MSNRKALPRMADVAKAAGVSSMTVSRALRGDASVTETRRADILKIAQEMGYILNRGASELRTRRTGFVAVTVPSINNPNFADSVRGLTDVLEQVGLQVLLGFTDYSVDDEERMIGQLLRRKPEALVVTGGTHTDGARALLANASIPVVETWDEPDAPIGYSVGFSNADAGARMARHLIKHGRRRIAFIGCDTGTDFRGEARSRGFFESVGQYGLETHRLIEAGKPPLGAQEGAQAAKTLLETYPDTDAVMCVADSVAFGAMTAFQRLGIAVPDQIAIAGFGAYDVSAFTTPAITTIEPHALQIGVLTGKLIARLLGPESDEPPVSHTGRAPTLIMRESTTGDSA
ncbi:MAG: LacI family DNA-binding transcriptional regulator [Pseudomonadota bacterium]